MQDCREAVEGQSKIDTSNIVEGKRIRGTAATTTPIGSIAPRRQDFGEAAEEGKVGKAAEREEATEEGGVALYRELVSHSRGVRC